ncbi:DUF2182 domain-containing protein [Mucilaginibacter sp. NFX135]|uniref:copper chaperone n=1 Tax=Mucilaginibacter sp. NFX135 TaxID=3402687 RepID=UPI003AFB163C
MGEYQPGIFPVHGGIYPGLHHGQWCFGCCTALVLYIFLIGIAGSILITTAYFFEPGFGHTVAKGRINLGQVSYGAFILGAKRPFGTKGVREA